MRLREETKPKRRCSQCCIILLLLLRVRFYGYLIMCVIFLFNFIPSPNDVHFFILHLDSLWIVVQSEVIISFASEMFD